MISVEVSGLFLARIRKLDLDRAAVFAAMQSCAMSWDQPHLHGGRGIRRLGKGVYE